MLTPRIKWLMMNGYSSLQNESARTISNIIAWANPAKAREFLIKFNDKQAKGK